MHTKSSSGHEASAHMLLLLGNNNYVRHGCGCLDARRFPFPPNSNKRITKCFSFHSLSLSFLFLFHFLFGAMFNVRSMFIQCSMLECLDVRMLELIRALL